MEFSPFVIMLFVIGYFMARKLESQEEEIDDLRSRVGEDGDPDDYFDH